MAKQNSSERKTNTNKDGVHSNDLGQPRVRPLSDAASWQDREEAGLGVLQGILCFWWSESMIKGG